MEARDKIEELILQNREEFSRSEPSEGHFARFEAKLNRQHKTKKVNFRMVWKVAAVVIFVLLAANQAAIYLTPGNGGLLLNLPGKNKATLASVSPEYKEVEFYYTNAINQGLSQWNNFYREGFVSEKEQKTMNAELNEFEQRYKNIQNDLSANPNDQRVINAMLEYYQTKLNVISMIVNKLKEVKQKNKEL
ncbi:MAG: hypothetical protein J7L95_05875 [Prolixibacteraceae bacterium]|nr:hypothetical protein [Prolixibacteraceae bacterium]